MGNGKVPADLFFNTLEEYGVRFGSEEEHRARQDHCMPAGGDLIKYERALKSFWYLKDTNDWVYSSPQATLTS